MRLALWLIADTQPERSVTDTSRKIIAAEVNYFTGERRPETTITRQRADRWTFYAPGWRPMAFSSEAKARAKLERHPGFVRWL